METLAIIAQVIKVAVDLTPTVIKTVEDAKPFAEAIIKAFNGKELSQAEITDLENKLTLLSNQLQAPLPAED